MCACDEMRVGAFLLTFDAYCAARSGAIFGSSADVLARLAFDGNATAVGMVCVWGILALLGLRWAASGYQATRTHTDPLRPGSLVWSVGVVALCVHLLQEPWPVNQPGDAAVYELARAFLVAWLTGNAVNIWLQLRGLFPRRSYHPPLPVPHSAAASSSIFWMRRRRIEEEFYRVEQRHGGTVPVDRFSGLPPLVGDNGRDPVLDHDEPGEWIAYEPVHHAGPVLPSRQRVRR